MPAMIRPIAIAAVLSVSWTVAPATYAEDAAPVTFDQVAPIFRTYCAGCHEGDEAEGDFSVGSRQSILAGGAAGPVLIPGQSDRSRLVALVEGTVEPVMPPEDNERPTEAEIALLKRWINSGVPGAEGDSADWFEVAVKAIPPVGEPRHPVTATAFSPDAEQQAVGRYRSVEIRDADGDAIVVRLDGPAGNVNGLCFSGDGSTLVAVGGEPGLYGEVVVYRTDDWSIQSRWRGHRDNIYGLALRPGDKQIATGSYDQTIRIWDLATGTEQRLLTGHNGAVFDLEFSPDGKLLASAGGDRTVKLWNPDTGERLDTFGQPSKEQYVLAFSRDGRKLVAGGADNKLRVWQISKTAQEGTNPLLYARYAHEAAIIGTAFIGDTLLVTTSEDRTVKAWETRTFTQVAVLEEQPDWSGALVAHPGDTAFVVGRQDGTLGNYAIDPRLANRTPPQPITPSAAVGGNTASGEMTTVAEQEPNDAHADAGEVSLPFQLTGVIEDPADDRTQDIDHLRFRANAGDVWVFETKAARMKSPLDSVISISHADGSLVQRLQLQAVRESWITFRHINDVIPDVRVEYWEEMGLNQYLYFGGEVTKTFLMPRGPDSGFKLYQSVGKRRGYFDTSAFTHAKEEPCYIVVPYAPDAELVDNGLPVFPLYYENDDDAQRELGHDSRLTFTAPADGEYVVQVRDARGFGGPDYKYELTARRPAPGFDVKVNGMNAKVGAGSGQRITFVADRHDDFEGAIEIQVSGVPEGYAVSTPTTIESGHLECTAVLTADADAVAQPEDVWKQVSVTASAVVAGEPIEKPIGTLGTVELQDRPKVLVNFISEETAAGSPPDDGVEEIVIRPGTTITAQLQLERFGYEGDLKFDVDNLPHGIIVDNIGLSGVLVRENETDRQIFLTAESWVEETTCWIYAVANGQGNPASRPVRLRVVKEPQVATAP